MKDAQEMSGSNENTDDNSEACQDISVENETSVSVHSSYSSRKYSPCVCAPLPRFSHKSLPTLHLPHHQRELRGLNSLLSETLGELLPTFRDIQSIETVVRELDEDAFPTFTRVSGEGITNPADFVRRFLEIEALERINIR